MTKEQDKDNPIEDLCEEFIYQYEDSYVWQVKEQIYDFAEKIKSMITKRITNDLL